MNNWYEDFSEASKKCMEPMRRCGEVAARTQSMFADKQFGFMTAYVEAGLKQFEALSESQDPKQLISRQSDIARQFAEKASETARELQSIQAQAQEELTQLMEDSMKGMDFAKPSARSVKKAA